MSSLASPEAEDPAPTRRSRLKSDRRSLLLAAAERQFAERGFLAVRLEDIGAAADVSGPAIYRHFPNKEALLVELLVGDQHPAAGRRAGRRGRHRGRPRRRWTVWSSSISTSPSANPT